MPQTDPASTVPPKGAYPMCQSIDCCHEATAWTIEFTAVRGLCASSGAGAGGEASPSLDRRWRCFRAETIGRLKSDFPSPAVADGTNNSQTEQDEGGRFRDRCHIK